MLPRRVASARQYDGDIVSSVMLCLGVHDGSAGSSEVTPMVPILSGRRGVLSWSDGCGGEGLSQRLLVLFWSSDAKERNFSVGMVRFRNMALEKSILLDIAYSSRESRASPQHDCNAVRKTRSVHEEKPNDS